jgi:hypothetical protein
LDCCCVEPANDWIASMQGIDPFICRWQRLASVGPIMEPAQPRKFRFSVTRGRASEPRRRRKIKCGLGHTAFHCQYPQKSTDGPRFTLPRRKRRPLGDRVYFPSPTGLWLALANRRKKKGKSLCYLACALRASSSRRRSSS